MICSVFRNKKTNEIERVEAPNNKESLLYNSLLPLVNDDKENALKLWAQVYTPSFKTWWGNSKNVDANGEPLIKNGLFDNGLSQKSIFNRGSFLSPRTDVSLRLTHSVINQEQDEDDVEITYGGQNEDAVHEFTILQKGKPVGSITTMQDGSYLNVIDSRVNVPKQNVGTNAYLKLASWAQSQGLQLRSDRIADRISPSALALWKRFSETSVAQVLDGHYVFSGDVNDMYGNVYYQQQSLAQKLDMTSRARQEDLTGVSLLERAEQLHDEHYKTVLDKLQTKFGIPWQVDNKQENVARFENGVVYVNMKKIKGDTPFHEYAHPFVETIRRTNPILYRSLASRAANVKYKGELVSSFVKKLYPELSGDDLDSEIITTILGLSASDPINISNDDAYKSFKERLLDFFRRVADIITSYLSDPGKIIKASDLSLILSFRDLAHLMFDGANPVETLAMDVDRAMYQKAEDTFNSLTLDQANVILDGNTHTYYYKGKKVEDSVSEKYVKPLYKKIFGDDNRTEIQHSIDDLYAEEGTKIHKDIENVISRYVDESTGLLRDKPLPRQGNPLSSEQSYRNIEEYISKKLASYPSDTRFMSEVRIYDHATKVAGTIDFIAIRDNGDVDILDWKSIQVEKKTGKLQDLQWWKEDGYREQLKAYKTILERQYKANVVYAAAIPIQADIGVTVKKGTSKANIRSKQSIKFGDVDARKISHNDNFLLPVVLQDQTTGHKGLDNLVRKLTGIYNTIKDQRASEVGDEKYEKDYKLLALQRAIKDVQVRMDVKALIDQGNTLIKSIRDQLKENTIDYGRAIEYKDILTNVYSNLQSFYSSLLIEEDYFTAEDKRELSRLQVNAKIFADSMDERIKSLAQDLANPLGIVDVTRAERKLDFLKKWFRSISTLPNATIRTFYSLVKKAQNARDVKTQAQLTKFTKLKSDLLKWADTNNIEHTKVFDKMLQKDENGKYTGKLIQKFSHSYYTAKDKAISKKDEQWMLKNTVFNLKRFKSAYASYEKYVNAQTFSVNAETNKKIKEERLKRYTIDNNPYDETGNLVNERALFNRKNSFISPDESWESPEWREINKKTNEPLFELYKEFQVIIKQAYKAGMLESQSNSFIPNILASRIDKLAFGNTKDLFNIGNLFNKAITDPYSGFGELDEVTGKLKKQVPVYFTNDLGNDKSLDLIKVFSIFAAHMHNYEAMTSLEDKAKVLEYVEKTKGSIVTNRFGKTKLDPHGIPVTVEGNEENAQVFNHLMNAVLYNQDIDADADFTFKFKGKEYSGKKFAKTVIQWMNVKTLGLNVISATSNLFGGGANAFFEASKRENFNEADWTKAGYLLATRDKVALAMLDRFDVFLEDQTRHHADKLSVSHLVDTMTVDKLFGMMRLSDRVVQYPVFIATAFNYMVKDGKIVSIKKYVREQNNYDGVYNRLTVKEKRALDKKINEQVDALKATSSIYKTAKIENDKLVIPGIDLDGEEAGNFRSLVKKLNKGILGNSTRDDITLARLSLIGQLGLQFRSWMPQMVTERFGDMSYDADLDQFKYGRYRLFIKNFLSPRILQLTKELIFGFGTDTIARAKERYADLLQRAIESGEISNASEFVSETQFIDQYLSSLRTQMRELMLLIAMSALVIAANPSGSDDDKKGLRKYAYRAFLRYQDEIGFYYSPQSFTDILKSPIPVVGFLKELGNFMTNTFEQTGGFLFNNEEWEEKAHPLKYLGRVFPISKELLNWWSAFDDDFRKEHNIIL